MFVKNAEITNTPDTRFDCLVDFTRGRMVEVGDHKWEPVDGAVVKYTYRDREPIEVDIVEAVKTAGPIVDRHRFWS